MRIFLYYNTFYNYIIILFDNKNFLYYNIMSGFINSTSANYGGKVSDTTTNVKQFIVSSRNQAIWIFKNIFINLQSMFIKVQTPAVSKTIGGEKIPVYIDSDLYVTGNIYGTLVNPSDQILKDNIQKKPETKVGELKNLEPKEFTYKENPSQKHYGFIAQDFEKIYPELVNNSVMVYKTINYIELIPLLISKINSMQKEIDELKIHL